MKFNHGAKKNVKIVGTFRNQSDTTLLYLVTRAAATEPFLTKVSLHVRCKSCHFKDGIQYEVLISVVKYKVLIGVNRCHGN